MYIDDTKIDHSFILQGDIILNFKFPSIVLKEGKYELVERQENIILLSQSCDLQFNQKKNDRFILCPLRTETQIRESLNKEKISEESVNGRISNMKGNKKLDVIYLPANNSIEDSFAIFPMMLSLQSEVLENNNISIRLNDVGRHFLADRLHMFLCRAFDPTK